MTDEQLKAKIVARNRVNTAANELQSQLLEFFKGFEGAKILKVDGSLLKSIAEKMPSLDQWERVTVYKEPTTYSLCFTVKSSENHSEFTCVYATKTVYVGRLSGSKLERIDAETIRRTDYTFDEAKEAYRKADELKKAYESARGELYPFE